MTMNVAPIVANFNRPNNPLLNRSHRIQVQSVAVAKRWTPVFIWQMNKQEMEREGVQGQTACFNALLSTQGPPVWEGKIDDDSGLSLRYGWGNETFTSRFEKSWPEPPGNFVMGAGASYWVEIADDEGIPSDRVTGVTLANPDDTDPFAHHTALIVWQLQDDDVPMVVDPRPDGGCATISIMKLRAAQQAAKALYDALMAMG